MNLLFQGYIFELLFKLGVILAIYWVFKRIVIPFVKHDRRHDQMEFYLPVIRNLALFFLVLEVIVNFGIINPLLTLVLVSGVVVLLWSYVKELFLGTVFKFQRGNISGQRLKVETYAGKIIQLNNTKIELETEKGEILQIPYSRVVGDVEIKPSTAKYLKACSLNIHIHAAKLDTFEKQLNMEVSNLPYVIDSIRPKVEIVSQTRDDVELKVVVYTNDEKFIPRIKSRLLGIPTE